MTFIRQPTDIVGCRILPELKNSKLSGSLADVQHPSALNEFQRYKQACSFLKTSRGRSKAWFQEALELDFQLHLRVDSNEVICRFFERNLGLWSEAPALDNESMRSPEKIAEFASQLIDLAKQSKANAIGVILHLADEFSTSELKAEYTNPAELPELRAAVEHAPSSILEGISISPAEYAWRILPYPAVGSETIATSISLSRQHAAFFDLLRATGDARNFPIICHALSAPLVALIALPEAAKPDPGKPMLAVLHYSAFTVMAFFNEHGDLRLIRTLQHRGQRRPQNLRHVATTTLAALELADPDVFVLPLLPEADPSVLMELRAAFPKRRVETVEWSQTPFSQQQLPAWCPEPLIATRAQDPDAAAFSNTFLMFAAEKWPLQNFLSIPKEIAEIYPTRQEFQLLRIVKQARLGIAAAAMVGAGGLIFGSVQRMQRPEWSFTPEQGKAVQNKLTALNLENQRIEHWDNLLDDRSKAWTSMELLCRLFPENSGVRLKGFSHSARPESATGKTKTGFVKEWKITGFARDEALDKLNTLSTRDGIANLFNEVARITGNNAFRPDLGNRSIVVNVRTLENGGARSKPATDNPDDPASYPFAFDMTITQRFEANDPLALNVAKAP